MNNNSSFLNEGVAHCPEKQKKAKEKQPKSCDNKRQLCFSLSSKTSSLQNIPTNDERCKHTLQQNNFQGDFAATGSLPFKQ